MVFTGVAAAVEKKLERYANSDIYHIMNAPQNCLSPTFWLTLPQVGIERALRQKQNKKIKGWEHLPLIRT